MIVVTGHMVCRPGSEERFAELARGVVDGTNRDEEGALVYTCSRDLVDPQRFVFVEHWADRDALRAHVATEHYRRFKVDTEPLVTAVEANIHTVEKTRTV